MDWKAVVLQIVTMLTQYLGPWITSWISSLFNSAPAPAPIPVPTPADPNAPKMGAAPVEIIAKFGTQILSWVQGAMSKFPFLGGIVVRFVQAHLDEIINGAWDKYFAAEIAANKLPAAQFLPMLRTMKATPFAPLSAADIAKCKAEAGIAA